MIFDTHAHYDDEAFNTDRDELLRSMEAHGIGRIVNIGANMETSARTVALTEQYPFLYGAVGVHPNEVGDMTEQDLVRLAQWTELEKVVAIGEIGLDYYWDDVPSDKQKEIFQLQVDLAKKHQKPIIIHCRDAYEDTYEVLKRNGHPGIMHCYSGSVEMAKRFIDLGFYISLAGPVTFKNARVPKDVAEKIGLEHLLIETDCPYLTPHPYRGSLNEPANVVYIAQEIAKLKNMEIESVASQTTFNAKKVFGIK